MSVPTSERGISAAPEVKLIRDLTISDITKIIRVTGGVPSDEPKPRWTPRDRKPQGFNDIAIHYPGKKTHLNIINAGEYFFLGVDGEGLLFDNSAIVLGNDAVTIVQKPEAIHEPTGAILKTATITKNNITISRRVLPLEEINELEEEIAQAVNLAGAYYR